MCNTHTVYLTDKIRLNLHLTLTLLDIFQSLEAGIADAITRYKIQVNQKVPMQKIVIQCKTLEALN